MNTGQRQDVSLLFVMIGPVIQKMWILILNNCLLRNLEHLALFLQLEMPFSIPQELSISQFIFWDNDLSNNHFYPIHVYGLGFVTLTTWFLCGWKFLEFQRYVMLLFIEMQKRLSRQQMQLYKSNFALHRIVLVFERAWAKITCTFAVSTFKFFIVVRNIC